MDTESFTKAKSLFNSDGLYPGCIIKFWLGTSIRLGSNIEKLWAPKVIRAFSPP